MSDRVMVFIDAQNLYRVARGAFFAHGDPSTHGNFHPNRLGQLVAAGRTLQQVRIYDGLPSSSVSPKAYSAHMKRIGAWKKSGVYVVTRPLRYRDGERH